MSYWVTYLRGPVDGESVFQADFYESREEAELAHELAQEYDDPDARLFEANECATNECDNYPEWGRKYCSSCR